MTVPKNGGLGTVLFCQMLMNFTFGEKESPQSDTSSPPRGAGGCTVWLRGNPTPGPSPSRGGAGGGHKGSYIPSRNSGLIILQRLSLTYSFSP